MKKLFCVSILFLSMSVLLGCEKSTTSPLNEAEVKFQKSDYSASSIVLKNILRNDPANKGARILLAKNYLKQGLFLNAEKEFGMVIKNEAIPSDIIALYLEALYALNDSLEIIKIWHENKIDLPISIKIQIAPIVSLSMAKENLVDEAKVLIDQSVIWASGANNIDAEIIAKSIQTSFSQNITKQQKINQLVDGCLKVPNQWYLCYMAANGQFANKNFDGAIIILEPIIKRLPYYIPPIIQLTESYIKSNRNLKAKKYLNVLLETYPNQPYINQLKALYSIQNQEFDNAKLHINKTTSSRYTTPETRLIAGIIDFQLENYEQALTHFLALKSSFPNNSFVKKILIAIHLKLGSTNSAYTELSQLELSGENAEIIAMAGLELLNAGEKNKANEILSNINTENVSNNNLLANIGIAKLSSGDESGIDDIEKLLGSLIGNEAESNDISKSKYLLISALLSTDQVERAKKQIVDWIKQEPKNLDNHLLQAEILLKEKPINSLLVDKAYQSVIDIDKNNLSANFYFAVSSFIAKNHKKADEYYRNILKGNKDNAKALKGLYVNSIKSGNHKAVLLEIESTLQYSKSNPERSLTLAEIYLYAQFNQKAVDTLNSIDFVGKTHSKIKYIILGDAYIALKQYTAAMNAYDQVINRDPISINILTKKLYAFEKSNDLNKAVDELIIIHKLHPDNVQIQLLLANYYALTNNAEEALNILANVPDEYQEMQFISKIKGIALYKTKHFSEALPFLLKDYNISPTDVAALYIFNIRLKTNQEKDALDGMEKHLLKFPNNVLNRMIYANELSKKDKFKAAVQYRKILELDKNNVISLNNLAWHLYEQKNFKEGLKYVNRAKSLAPDNNNVSDTYNKIIAALNTK